MKAAVSMCNRSTLQQRELRLLMVACRAWYRKEAQMKTAGALVELERKTSLGYRRLQVLLRVESW